MVHLSKRLHVVDLYQRLVQNFRLLVLFVVFQCAQHILFCVERFLQHLDDLGLLRVDDLRL